MLNRLSATLLAILLAGTIFAPRSSAGAEPARSAQAPSVCDYAKMFASLRGQISGFNISFSRPLGDQYDQLYANLDTINGMVSMLQGLTPPAGFEQFHADLLRAIQRSQTALQQIVSALDEDETPSVMWEDVLRPIAQFALSVADKYPSQGSQIEACG